MAIKLTPNTYRVIEVCCPEMKQLAPYLPLVASTPLALTVYDPKAARHTAFALIFCPFCGEKLLP